MWQTNEVPGGTKKPAGPFTEAVAGILRGKIATAKLTHQEVADAVGISRSQVSKIVNGEKRLDMETLDELCWALGLSFRKTVDDADEQTAERHLSDDWTTPTLVRR